MSEDLDFSEATANDKPLEIVEAKLPEVTWSGDAPLGDTYTVTLVLNRRPLPIEHQLITDHPFRLNLALGHSDLLAKDTTLEEIQKVAVELNDFVKKRSAALLETMHAKQKERQDRAARELINRTRLEQLAKQIKFDRD